MLLSHLYHRWGYLYKYLYILRSTDGKDLWLLRTSTSCLSFTFLRFPSDLHDIWDSCDYFVLFDIKHVYSSLQLSHFNSANNVNWVPNQSHLWRDIKPLRRRVGDPSRLYSKCTHPICIRVIKCVLMLLIYNIKLLLLLYIFFQSNAAMWYRKHWHCIYTKIYVLVFRESTLHVLPDKLQAGHCFTWTAVRKSITVSDAVFVYPS